MGIAIRNLLYAPFRALLSVVGIALAIMLIILLGGLQDGMARQISTYLEHSPGSVVIAQDGVSNLLGSTSMVPAGTDDTVRDRVPGARVVPILSQYVVAELHSAKQPIYLIGYDPESGGGPWMLESGSEPQNDEIVFDSVLADRHDIGIGDRIDLMGHRLRVSGLSGQTASWMTSFVFVQRATAETLLHRPSVSSFLLVTPPTGLSATDVASRLDALPGVDGIPKDRLIDNDVDLFLSVFSPPIRLMSGIAFLIGTLVVALVIYTATVERRREYGVLTALGADSRLLYRVVGTQALAIGIPGALLGLVLSLAAARSIMTLRPQFLIIFEPGEITRALVVGALMALASAIGPAWVIARLSPADVFRR